MSVFITRTGSFLPGLPVDNAQMHRFIGEVDGEHDVKQQVLKMNGIRQRHYALNEDQSPTHDVYELACEAVQHCISTRTLQHPVSYLSAGSTHTPYSGPGISSLLHGMLAKRKLLTDSVEVNSNSGICTSSAAALQNAFRAVRSGDHDAALCVGAERPSEVLKSSAFRGEYNPDVIGGDIRKSEWFMSAFLRFMLSDGAGAVLLETQPASNGHSFEINWAYSRSFAHEAPLCMTMDNRKMLLSQDVDILSRHLFECSRKFVGMAMRQFDETLDIYDAVLPHLSSFFFQRRMERIMKEFLNDHSGSVPYWTNLATVGNTGAASILVMLDEYTRTQPIAVGDRILLFIPESGQFNFVLFSLTVH